MNEQNQDETTEAESIQKVEVVEPEKHMSIHEAAEAAYEETSTGDEDEPVVEKKAEETETDFKEDQPGEEGSEEAADSDSALIPAPPTWSKDARASWKDLPREVQQYITQRDKDQFDDHSRKTRKIAETQKRYEGMDRVLNPQIQDEFTRRGITSEQFIAQALLVDKNIRTNPLRGAAQFLQSIGIHPQQLLEQASNPAAQLSPKEVEYQRRIQALEQRQQAQVQHAQTARDSSIDNVIASFTNETDDNGNLLRPYLPELENEMATVVPQIMQKNPQMHPQQALQEAYDYCSRGNPNTWAKIQQDQEQQREAQKAKDAAAKVAKARLAGASIGQTGGGNSVGHTVPDNLRDIVAQAWDTCQE